MNSATLPDSSPDFSTFAAEALWLEIQFVSVAFAGGFLPLKKSNLLLFADIGRGPSIAVRTVHLDQVIQSGVGIRTRNCFNLLGKEIRMSPISEPDAKAIREAVLKCVVLLHKQTELLYRRLYLAGIRLNELDTELRNKEKIYKDSN